MRALPTLFVLATAAGLSLAAACTSGGTTANCSGDAACGVPAGDASEETSSSDTGAGDSGSANETGAPETGSRETGSPETGSPETGPADAASDAPKG